MAKAKDRYNKKNYDQVLLRLPKGSLERVKALAEKSGVSVNSYILQTLKIGNGES